MPVELEGLLQSHDGACTAWVDLFFNILNAQGIDDVRVYSCSITDLWLQNDTNTCSVITNCHFSIIGDGGFLIKNWNLLNPTWSNFDTNRNYIDDTIEHDCPNVIDFDDVGDMDDFVLTYSSFLFPYEDTIVNNAGITNLLVTGNGLKGQGNIIPSIQKFITHYIVIRGEPNNEYNPQSYVIYDPSYGVRYEGMNAIKLWLNNSVEAFWRYDSDTDSVIYAGQYFNDCFIQPRLVPDSNSLIF